MKTHAVSQCETFQLDRAKSSQNMVRDWQIEVRIDDWKM
jgi:hypothetical protein